MEQTNSSGTNHEAQRICSLFHYGWISKKEVGPIERNLELYWDVEAYLAQTGYELINPPGTEWYIIRLKKEFDTNAFDDFLKRASGINRNHMALLVILYAKLILPKELQHVDPETKLSVTVDELVYNYGPKFQQGKQNHRKTIETLLKSLKRYNYILMERGKPIITAGPSMYMLRSDLMQDICAFVIQGITDSINTVEKIQDEKPDDGEEDVE